MPDGLQCCPRHTGDVGSLQTTTTTDCESPAAANVLHFPSPAVLSPSALDPVGCHMLSRGPQGVEGRDTGRRQGGLTGFQEIGMICLGDECLVPPHPTPHRDCGG